jgi:multiple sugar transport system permease protein
MNGSAVPGQVARSERVGRPTFRRTPRATKLVVIYATVFLLLVWSLAPVLWVVISSISTRIELYSVPIKHWIPLHPTIDNYKVLFQGGPNYLGGSSSGANTPSSEILLAGLRNSLITSLGAAIILTVLSTLAGYAFARLRFRGRSILFLLMVFLLPLPIWMSLIRLYFLITNMGLSDTNVGIIIVLVAYGLPLYVWIMETYIRTTPPEIEEAAMVDGCSRVGALIRVILPMAVPGLATVFLTALLTSWNAFLVPLIFANTESSQTLPVVLSLFIGQYGVAWEAMAAASVLTLLPPLLIALFFQRYLTRGLSLGAVR